MPNEPSEWERFKTVLQWLVAGIGLVFSIFVAVAFDQARRHEDLVERFHAFDKADILQDKRIERLEKTVYDGLEQPPRWTGRAGR